MHPPSLRTSVVFGLLLVAGLVTVACAKQVDRQLSPSKYAATLDNAPPYIKAHLLDGGVFVL